MGMSGRALLRGARSTSRLRDDEDRSDKSSVSSQDSEMAPLIGDKMLVKEEIKQEVTDEIDFDMTTDFSLENIIEKAEGRVLDKKVSSSSSQKGSNSSRTKMVRKAAKEPSDKLVKDDLKLEETELTEKTSIVENVKEEPKEIAKEKKTKNVDRMKTRPRRDSSSSLVAAAELKAKKDEICDKPTKSKGESSSSVNKKEKEIFTTA